MLQRQGNLTAPPGVLKTLSAGFELTTRYLWLMILPALLDLFLWIGPRLSFRPLMENLFAQFPVEAMLVDPQPILETALPRLNHFTYLSVSLLGVPVLMSGLAPEKSPLQPPIIEGNGWGQWFGLLLLFTLAGLLLTAVYFSTIRYAMRRSSTNGLWDEERGGVYQVARTWGRLIALLGVYLALIIAVSLPISFMAGFAALISPTIATLFLLGALVLIFWILVYLGFTPQGMAINPHGFRRTLRDSIRLLQQNLSPAISLLLIIMIIRWLLGSILHTADTGTWVTSINILAHAYINTALTVALFLFYRDRYPLLETKEPAQTLSDQFKQ